MKWLTSGAISQDGRYFVSGSIDNKVKIWYAETGNFFSSLIGYENKVNFCSFSPDVKWVLSGGDDKTVRLWNINNGNELIKFICNDKVRACAISGCGTLISCGDKLGNLYLLKLEGFENRVPIVTGVRFWLNSNGGVWDKEISAVCPHCGVWFPCTKQENAICDDPKLLQNCPDCGKKIKLNPFLVDNKGRWD
jgi:WD40 repeat protein